MGKACVRCPAGQGFHAIDGALACLCRIEGVEITTQSSPTSLAAYCTNHYDQCPTWRTYKEAIWARRERQLEADIDRSPAPAPERERV